MKLDDVQDDELLTTKDIVGNTRAKPPTRGLVPVCASTWETGVRAGRYPQPIFLAPGVRRWRAGDIKKLLREGIPA